MIHLYWLDLFLKERRVLFSFLSILIYCFVLSETFAGENMVTIHSSVIQGNWDSPDTWQEWRVPNENDIVEVSGQVTLNGRSHIHGIIISSWGTLGWWWTLTVQWDIENRWILSWPASLALHGNIINRGTWEAWETRIYSTSGNTILDSTSPISGNLWFNTDVSIPHSFHLFGSLISDDNGNVRHKVTFSDSQGIEIHGNVHNLFEISWSGSFINLQWQAHYLSLSGSLDSFNVLSDGTLVGNVSISANRINYFSGASMGYLWWHPLNFVADTSLLYIQTGALFALHNAPSAVAHVTGDVLNEGTLGWWWTLTVQWDIENRWILSWPASVTIWWHIENKGEWNSPTFISWPSYPWISEYTLFFTPWSSTGIVTTANLYDVTDKVTGHYYWTIWNDDVPSSVVHCINMGCASGWSNPPPVNTISAPTNLTQQVQGPYMTTPDPIGFWQKIGKYQSGSGVILSANVSNEANNLVRLVFDIYTVWSDSLKRSSTTEYDTTSWIRSVIVPYSYLWAWSYYWKVKAEDKQGNSSQAVSAWVDDISLADFILYEWFEPYPYGYKFKNNEPGNWFIDNPLTGWIGKTLWTGERYKIDGNKWIIFNKIFPESRFRSVNAMFDGFEQLWLQSGTGFNFWNCFGMAVSATMQYTHPVLLQQYFPYFSAKIWNSTIWEKIEPLHTNFITSKWDVYNEALEVILQFQLMQNTTIIGQKLLNHTSFIDAYETIKNNNDGTYVLAFWWTRKNWTNAWHAVIPYKVESLSESKRIYIWDNNYPLAPANNSTGTYWYNQYIEIYTSGTNSGTWKLPSYDWNSFDKISLISLDSISYSINQIFNPDSQSTLMWFNGSDMVATLNGESDITITDSIWRASGFSGWTILEGIPWVRVIVPLNATLTGSPDNTWKQIYLPQKLPWLTFKVSGKTGEQYNLMIAWWNYYTKVEWVTTSTGQLDSYQVTWTGIVIDFDNQKTGNYSLLTDNFQDTLTGTVFLSGIVSTPSPQKISYDWNKVIQKTTDAILYQIDNNSDGVYDTSSNFFAIPTSPQATWSISWYVKWNTNATMAGWKVILTKQQDPTCKENKKKGDKGDNYKNKDNRECRNYDDNEKDEKDKNNKNEQYHDGRDDRKDEKDREDKDHNREIFAITDKKWYYRFTNLSPWTYSISIESQRNWSIIKPQNNIYTLTLSSWQNIINLNFETTFLKGKSK